ncbi:MAG: hypothetical protein QOI35_3592, partial [Cryptosporangiaceae bacterium]|nr:hypothetical protein [Cryptosporangiaceae bacterium]
MSETDVDTPVEQVDEAEETDAVEDSEDSEESGRGEGGGDGLLVREGDIAADYLERLLDIA